MNHLAHFHLAWPDSGLIAGGLEGDYYKGPLRGDLHPDIERGIKLHRSVDAYTDTHPALAELRSAFPKKLRRYAGIVTDIAFDHYLTQHWSRYSALTLKEFNHSIYGVLDNQQALLSEDCLKMAERLTSYDVLNRYHDWNAVSATAGRVGERFHRGNPLLEIHDDLEPLREAMEEAFLDFYPQLMAFTGTMRHGSQRTAVKALRCTTKPHSLS